MKHSLLSLCMIFLALKTSALWAMEKEEDNAIINSWLQVKAVNTGENKTEQTYADYFAEKFAQFTDNDFINPLKEQIGDQKEAAKVATLEYLITDRIKSKTIRADNKEVTEEQKNIVIDKLCRFFRGLNTELNYTPFFEMPMVKERLDQQHFETIVEYIFSNKLTDIDKKAFAKLSSHQAALLMIYKNATADEKIKEALAPLDQITLDQKTNGVKTSVTFLIQSEKQQNDTLKKEIQEVKALNLQKEQLIKKATEQEQTYKKELAEATATQRLLEKQLRKFKISTGVCLAGGFSFAAYTYLPQLASTSWFSYLNFWGKK